jgi:hypothetical protein
MAEYLMSVDEFVEFIEPELEYQVDQMILSAPDLEMRLAMMKHREKILRECRQATLIANLRHRLGEAEARLRPTLVHDRDGP